MNRERRTENVMPYFSVLRSPFSVLGSSFIISAEEASAPPETKPPRRGIIFYRVISLRSSPGGWTMIHRYARAAALAALLVIAGNALAQFPLGGFGGGASFLLANPDVRQELKLTEEQTAKAKDLI